MENKSSETVALLKILELGENQIQEGKVKGTSINPPKFPHFLDLYFPMTT